MEEGADAGEFHDVRQPVGLDLGGNRAGKAERDSVIQIFRNG